MNFISGLGYAILIALVLSLSFWLFRFIRAICYWIESMEKRHHEEVIAEAKENEEISTYIDRTK